MKLKCHISFILSAFILFSNIGLALNVHYCHGQVSEVTLSYKTENCIMQKTEKKVMGCCAKAAAEKKCCKNHTVKIQDDSDKAIVKSLQLDLGSFYIANAYKPLNLFVYEEVSGNGKDAPAFYAESTAPPLYKLYCQYTLYA
ncbi:HYC_CC_PP family protein [Flavobacterium rhizosphaerae]|uniref:Uncharacterized protein n=1 Tax=Flavobacterium rhizosphaerae TaxID=3163298 RepID=A0ABW8YU43_9FLAO